VTVHFVDIGGIVDITVFIITHTVFFYGECCLLTWKGNLSLNPEIK